MEDKCRGCGGYVDSVELDGLPGEYCLSCEDELIEKYLERRDWVYFHTSTDER